MQKYMLSLKAQNELAFFNNGLLFEIFFFQQLICYLFVRLCFQFFLSLMKFDIEFMIIKPLRRTHVRIGNG